MSQNRVSVNIEDELGNTALHHAVMRDHRALTVALLQCGADTSKSNKSGEICGIITSLSRASATFRTLMVTCGKLFHEAILVVKV